MGDSEKYVSRYTGERIKAVLLTQRQSFEDFDGNRTYAEAGEYLVTSPYMDKVDRETFEQEYERHERTE